MSSSGHAFIKRVRSALVDTERALATRHDPVRDGLVELFVERVEEHRATVHRCTPEQVEDTLAEVLRDHDTVVPEQFPWPVPHAVREASLEGADLEGFGCVATTATLGIATAGPWC